MGPILQGISYDQETLQAAGVDRAAGAVAGVRRSEGESFSYNPKDSWLVEPGQTLVVLGDAADVKRAREEVGVG